MLQLLIGVINSSQLRLIVRSLSSLAPKGARLVETARVARIVDEMELIYVCYSLEVFAMVRSRTSGLFASKLFSKFFGKVLEGIQVDINLVHHEASPLPINIDVAEDCHGFERQLRLLNDVELACLPPSLVKYRERSIHASVDNQRDFFFVSTFNSSGKLSSCSRAT